MVPTVSSRRLIALLAAYVVALQALLLPLTIAAGATFEPHLCAASSADGAPPPLSHDSVCPCAAGCGMQCCAQILAVPPQDVSLRGPASEATALALPEFGRAVAPAQFGAQRARGPPLA